MPARNVAGSLVAVVTFGLAQPLLDLLGRNAAFLVAHQAGRTDVLALALGLPIVLPLVLALAVLAVARLNTRAGAAAHASLLGLFGVVLALVVLRLGGLEAWLPAPVVVVVAVVAGGAVPLLYRRSAGLRGAANIAALAAPVVAVLFLFVSPAQALLFPQPPAAPLPGLDADAPPIVFVVFDELPVASLLDVTGDIDATAYPSFARLAADGTFFRNASTVHGQTSDAVPAALTGRYPDSDKLPLVSDHPDNLLALLSGSYDLNVVEPLTGLCPPGRCAQRDTGGRAALVRDLAVVGSHLVLPTDLTGSLPPIDQGWRDFRGDARTDGKETAVRDRFRAAREVSPVTVFDEFLEGVRARPDPTLHFLHLLLPHSPWNYLPSGRQYNSTRYPAGLERGRWLDDEWQVAQAYQRHLLQLQLTDRLLGRLLDRLETEQMYDEALVVVMADHGASFTPETSLRVAEPATVGEIAAVPLLIKRPGRGPSVSDRPVETVDILPTVLEVLGVGAPAGVEGQSAFTGPGRPARRQLFTSGGALPLDDEGAEKWPVVRRKANWFGRSDAYPMPFGLAPEGHADLLGLAVPDGLADAADLTATIDGAYDTVDLEREPAPAMVEGTIHDAGSGTDRHVVAVGVNGRIVAVTLADPGADAGFRAVLPPGALRPGRNDIELLGVGETGELVRISRSG